MMSIPHKNERNDIPGVMQIINTRDCSGQIISFNDNDMLYVNHFAGMTGMIIQKAQMRDPKETGAHVNRVASYSVEIYELWAKHKGLPDREIRDLSGKKFDPDLVDVFFECLDLIKFIR
ncbi:MAG TPA: hypothetical protein PK514_06620 [Spirochaetota bacterium]|nr:hypothetical protein [Spirochaetota bacterium]